MRTFTFVLLSLAAVYSDNVANAYATIHPELSKYYHERDLGTMLPHVFAITDGACLSDLAWGQWTETHHCQHTGCSFENWVQ